MLFRPFLSFSFFSAYYSLDFSFLLYNVSTVTEFDRGGKGIITRKNITFVSIRPSQSHPPLVRPVYTKPPANPSVHRADVGETGRGQDPPRTTEVPSVLLVCRTRRYRPRDRYRVVHRRVGISRTRATDGVPTSSTGRPRVEHLRPTNGDFQE